MVVAEREGTNRQPKAGLAKREEVLRQRIGEALEPVLDDFRRRVGQTVHDRVEKAKEESTSEPAQRVNAQLSSERGQNAHDRLTRPVSDERSDTARRPEAPGPSPSGMLSL